MTRADVETLAAGTLVNDQGDTLTYVDSIDELPCRVTYVFAQGRLVQIEVMLQRTHTDPNEYIADYRAIVSNLTAAHGKPFRDRTIWKDSQPRDAEDLGASAAAGEVMMSAVWYKPDIQVACLLWSSDGDIAVAVEFKSPLLNPPSLVQDDVVRVHARELVMFQLESDPSQPGLQPQGMGLKFYVTNRSISTLVRHVKMTHVWDEHGNRLLELDPPENRRSGYGAWERMGGIKEGKWNTPIHPGETHAFWSTVQAPPSTARTVFTRVLIELATDENRECYTTFSLNKEELPDSFIGMLFKAKARE